MLDKGDCKTEKGSEQVWTVTVVVGYLLVPIDSFECI